MYKLNKFYSPRELNREDLIEFVELLKLPGPARYEFSVETKVDNYDLRFASLDDMLQYPQLPSTLDNLHIYLRVLDTMEVALTCPR